MTITKQTGDIAFKTLSVLALVVSIGLVIGITLFYTQRSSDVQASGVKTEIQTPALDNPVVSQAVPVGQVIDPATALELKTLATTPAPIDPDSLSIQTFDFEADGTLEYIVYFEQALTAAEQRLAPGHDSKSGFRIYREVANTWTLYYEDVAKVGQPMSTNYYFDAATFFTPADLDLDGAPEVIINSRVDGTGAYNIQYVLKSIGKNLIYRVEAVQTKTHDELTAMLLKPGETLGASQINATGGGYQFICPVQSNCNSEQSGPNAIGVINYDLIYFGDQFEATNYTRQDY